MSTSSFSLYNIILKLIIFLSLVSVAVLAIEYRIRHDINNDFMAYKYRYDELFNNKTNAELLIIGTSHAAHGIVPRNINVNGYEVYNFSFNGAGPSFIYDLYKNIINPYYTKPKLIIYEVNWFMFDSKIFWRKISQDYKYMSSENVFKITNNNLSTVMMPYDYLRITHESDVFRAVKSSFKHRKFDNILIDHYDNGFVPNETSYNTDNSSFEVHNNATEINCLETLAALIKSQKIPLVFVETPEHLNDRKSVNLITENNKLISSIAKKHGIEFLNYNDGLKSNINSNKRYFSDPGHLNYLGARTFSNMLSKDINNLIITKDFDYLEISSRNGKNRTLVRRENGKE